MKKFFITGLIMSTMFTFIACQKQSLNDASSTTPINGSKIVTGKEGPPTGGNCELFAFGLLGLNGGTFTINSSINLIADVGYSKLINSTTNQKINNFTGRAYVHSQVTNFVYTAATYRPTGGIVRNNAAANAKLDAANANAITISNNYAGFTPNYTFGTVTTNQTINSVANNTVVQISSLDYNSKILTLNGTPGEDDGFIINVLGSFDFSQSKIQLNNVRPERVIFNFPNPSAITINKASNVFRGTILAPTGSVIYHNPASFEGSIIALNIAVHSDFNLTQRSYCDGSSGN